MNESEAVDFLMEAVYVAAEDAGDEDLNMRTFEDACLMTYNKGFVMRMPDGSEFQVQVLRSN